MPKFFRDYFHSIFYGRPPAIKDWCMWEDKYHSFDLYSGKHRANLEPKQDESNKALVESSIFRLPFVCVPRDEYEKYFKDSDGLSASVCSAIKFIKDRKEYFRFFIHPSTAEQFKKILPPGCRFVEAAESQFFASPTTSIRSFVVWDQNQRQHPFVVKLSVFEVRYGFSRHIDWLDASRSLFARELIRLGGSKAPLAIKFMDEVAITGLPCTESIHFERETVVPEFSNEVSCFGNIIREFPSAVLSGKITLMSCVTYCSLQRKPDTFIEKIASSQGLTPEASLRKSLIEPGKAALTALMSRSGIIIEPHAQNLLIELDHKLTPTGSIWFRDFSTVCIDPFQAFLCDPHFLAASAQLNDGIYLSTDYATRAREWTVRSIAHNFLICNVFRTILALSKRKIISDARVNEMCQQLEDYFLSFLISYHGNKMFPREFLFSNQQDAIASTRLPFLKRITDPLSIISQADASAWIQRNNKLHAAGFPPGAKRVNFGENLSNEDITWYEHKHGLIEASGGRINAIHPGALQ